MTHNLRHWLDRRPLLHVNGGSRIANCANCHEPGAGHRGTDGRFYCNDFCEEGGPQDRRAN